LARQKQFDRRVADLTVTITRLQSTHRTSKEEVTLSAGGASNSNKEKELEMQVASLSEDLIRQRGKLQNASTEVLTLKNRLKSALSRAETAEQAVHATRIIEAHDVERGMGGGSNKNRKKYGVRGRKTSSSIRSALKLNGGRGNARESVGNIVDAIDALSLQTGKFFQSDPLARLIFLLYLVVLHLWAFCLVLFHAHGTLEPASDVGPEQLLKHSYRHQDQVN